MPHTDDKETERKILSDQLTRVSSQRTAENTVLWVVFTIVSTANVQLVREYLVAGDCNCIPRNTFVGVTLCVIGLLISILFALIFLRALAHIKRLEVLSEKIEIAIGVTEFSFNEKLNETHYLQGFGCLKNVKARWVLVGVMGVWFLIFLVGLFQSSCACD
jgi:hypothetical protein